MLSQFGTFDVENYGDLMYPIIMQHMLDKRGFKSDIKKLSFLNGKAPCDAGYSTTGIKRSLYTSPENCFNLIVGGGDILRTDWDTMASHYKSQHINKLRRSLWGRLRLKVSGENSISKVFQSKYMSYPAPGPFIIDPSDYASISSLSYYSCGVPFELIDHGRKRIADAFNQANFICVRDSQSRDKLLHAGVINEIHVAPDIIVTISDFYNKAEQQNKGEHILKKHGLNTNKRTICFQCPRIGGYKQISEALSKYSKSRNFNVVLLPIGRCHGDIESLKTIQRLSNNAFKFIDCYSVYDTLSVITASDIFIGTSMHGNMSAFSFGIPCLFAPLNNVDKIDGFIKQAGLDKRYKLASYQELDAAADEILSIPSDERETHAKLAKNKAHHMFDLFYRHLTRINNGSK